jgi:hypothetical protein
MLTKQLFSLVKRHLFIKNEHVTSCSNCLFFIKSPSLNKDLGKCKQFGEKNIITGEIENLYALTCRKDKSLCGLEARHFLQNFGQNLGK